MTMINVAHHPGRHCASTGICNLVNYHGVRWSEAMCFGLGEGLGIWFIDFPKLSPSRIVHVRTIDLEAQFFNRIGYPFSWDKFKTPEESEAGLCARLDQGLPVILRTDLYYLPYYESNTHYPGHVITVWGYDRTEQIFYVTDTERENVLEVPFGALGQARFCREDFLHIEGDLFAPANIPVPDDISERIRRAILANSRAILEYGHLQGITGIVGGMAGLEKWQNEVIDWVKLEDWQWASRFAYQVIEKRGTGGGGFRLMYADFLEEAKESIPEISSRGLHQQMREVGQSWRDLAIAFKKASEVSYPDFGEVAHRLNRVAQLESSYHHEALALESL
ncbi:MAG: BtrH N-terminal domain-containing protein [Deltaproteobacteria bacterium]|nr:BtrH N-terminal domain-containing protein [Deltaproteobacteria bacterium]